MSGRGRRTGWFGVLLALVFALCVPGSNREAAAAEADGVTVALETGVRGYVLVGKAMPIRVTVTTDHTTRGTVRLSDLGGPRWVVVERDLSLAAGTSKSFWMVLPAMTNQAPSTPTVTFLEQGDRQISTTSRFLAADSLVGVLPRLAAAVSPPATVTKPDGSGDAHLGTVSAEQLELGVPGLELFTAIAASGRDLAALSETAKAGLWQWLNRGGLLLVDDDPGAELPPAWVPGPAGYALAGAGEVRLTEGALARGEWAPFLLGASEAASLGPMEPQAMMFFPGNGVTTLAQDAGLRLNRLGPVLAILVVYVLLVGPVMFIVLRRTRRLPAGWLAIPLFAILTTGLVVVVGNRSRMGGSGAHGTVFAVSPAGTEAYVSGLVLSRSGGDHGFQLPSGWAPTTGRSMFTSFDGNAATHRVDGDGSDLVRSLDSGQAAVFKAVGPAAAPNDQLRVEATSEANGTISGSVHNPGSNALVDVAVFAGERAVLIGTLPAGTSAPFELLDVTASAGIAPAAQVWSMDQRFGGPAMPIGPPVPTMPPGTTRPPMPAMESSGPGGVVPVTVEAGGPGGPAGPGGAPDRPALPATTASQTADVGLWLEASVDNPLLTYGSVRAAGWRPDTTAPLELLGGRRIDRGRSAVTVAAPIEPAGPITDVTVRRKLTSLSGEVGPDGQTALFRFLLPPNSRPPNVDYELTIPVGMGSAEAWNGARWVSMQAPEGVSLLPSETVRSGVVLIRIDGLMALSFSAGLTVREQL